MEDTLNIPVSGAPDWIKDDKKVVEEIKESLNTNLIGEAPASATLSVVTPKGYNTLFTLREMSGETLLKKIGALETKLDELGYKPQVKMAFGQKKEIEYADKLCPIDGGKLKVIHAKTGVTYWGCENSKYDPTTKISTGCKFFCKPEEFEVKKSQFNKVQEEMDVASYDPSQEGAK